MKEVFTEPSSFIFTQDIIITDFNNKKTATKKTYRFDGTMKEAEKLGTDIISDPRTTEINKEHDRSASINAALFYV